MTVVQPAATSILALANTPSQPTDHGMFYGGESRESHSGAYFDVIEPATGEQLARLPDGDVRDVDAAVAAAEAAAPGWSRMSIADRAAVLLALGERVRDFQEQLGMLDARDTGSPVAAMTADARKGAASLITTAGLGYEMKGQTIPVAANSLHYTKLEPWGVVARIIAFNHPILFACSRLAPALLAGNVVILKPSESAPMGALALAELADGIVPEGVLSVLTGGPVVGNAIAENPLIRRLSFTGGVPTGLKVMAASVASGVIKDVTLELGGKNPIIVFPDADLEAAAAAVVRGMNFSRVQGQSCGSTSRLLVHEAVHSELVELVNKLVLTIRIGDPTNPATEMGCLITHSARERSMAFVNRAVAGGARLAAGGQAPDDASLRRGPFLLPTILDDVAPDSEIAREEVFGPVLSVIPWSDEESMVRVANDVRYGLTASVWSRDIGRALRTADELDAGYIWVNDVETRYPAVPFGGWKDSGRGLEHGLAEVISFTRTKAVNIAY